VGRGTPINVRWLLAGRHNDMQQAGVPLSLAEQVRLWSKMRQAATVKSATGEPDYKALMWDVLVATGATGLPYATDEKKVYSAEYSLSLFQVTKVLANWKGWETVCMTSATTFAERWKPPLPMAWCCPARSPPTSGLRPAKCKDLRPAGRKATSSTASPSPSCRRWMTAFNNENSGRCSACPKVLFFTSHARSVLGSQVVHDALIPFISLR
jgi:hypothetical protein